MSREGRSQPIQPFASHGFVDSGVGVPGTTPPPPVNVDRADQRVRYRPLDPISISAALNSVTFTPAVSPPEPFVVPLDERRRFLAALPSTSTRGFDDATPPDPNVSEPDDRRRRYRPLDPISIVGFPADQFAQIVVPPGPYVVPLEERRRFLVALDATGKHGYVDPGPGPVGTTPPPALNIDRADQRVRYLPLPALAFASGPLAASIPFVPPVVQGGTDWASMIFGG